MDGEGKLTYFTGDVFEGKWSVNNLCSGTITYSHGDKYVGEWKNSLKWGEVKILFIIIIIYFYFYYSLLLFIIFIFYQMANRLTKRNIGNIHISQRGCLYGKLAK